MEQKNFTFNLTEDIDTNIEMNDAKPEQEFETQEFETSKMFDTEPQIITQTNIPKNNAGTQEKIVEYMVIIMSILLILSVFLPYSTIESNTGLSSLFTELQNESDLQQDILRKTSILFPSLKSFIFIGCGIAAIIFAYRKKDIICICAGGIATIQALISLFSFDYTSSVASSLFVVTKEIGFYSLLIASFGLCIASVVLQFSRPLKAK